MHSCSVSVYPLHSPLWIEGGGGGVIKKGKLPRNWEFHSSRRQADRNLFSIAGEPPRRGPVRLLGCCMAPKGVAPFNSAERWKKLMSNCSFGLSNASRATIQTRYLFLLFFAICSVHFSMHRKLYAYVVSCMNEK
jgi:hypothetical protein